MSLRQKFSASSETFMDALRLKLAKVDAAPQFAVLGILSGLLAGGVVIAFRLLVESTQAAFLPEARPENYEALSPLYRFSLPLVGGFLIGALMQITRVADRRVGIVHVLERLAYHQGYLPFRNLLVQFIGGGLSIIFGHSVGREGPGVHLGAASSTLLGRQLGLPNNALRTLAGCGTAAAIGAFFNTPLAGVVFAMEVVIMEYTIAGFAPVILAAVSATALSQWVYGADPSFSVPPLTLGALVELPYMLGMGLVVGTLSALLIRSLVFFSGLLNHWPLWMRTSLAGLVVGLCALPVPEIMGVGYDTVEATLVGHVALVVLIGIVVLKIFATAASLGFGLPAGIIGPTLVIGAAAGGAMGQIAEAWFPVPVSSNAFYALVGMGAMMGATLQAPLAALTAMLELTANPHVILPGMLAVIASGLVCRQLWGTDSVFLTLMRARGLDYRNDPISQSLRRVGVASAMARNFSIVPRLIEREKAQSCLQEQPRWLLVEEERQPKMLMPAADLVHHLEGVEPGTTVDLLEIPARRLQVTAVHLQATMQEALETLRKHNAEAVYIVRPTVPGINRIYGVLTAQDIEEGYRY